MKLMLIATGLALFFGIGNAITQQSLAVGIVSAIFVFLFGVLPREAIRWQRHILFLLKPKTAAYYQARAMVHVSRW